VRVQLPLLASHTSLPEPDFAVVKGDERTFEASHPTGSDTVLVIEVSWSSRKRDRRKAAIYGRAGAPVYWRLDLEQRRLEVHEKPAPDGTYTAIHVLDDSAEVELSISGARWRVRDLLLAAPG